MVTGASGFIGEFVVQELLRRKHRLIALVRSAVPAEWSGLENLEVIRSDLRQPGLLNLEGRGIDAVLHLAAVTRRAAAQPFEDTVTATANLLTAARRAGIRRLVGISSIAVLDYRSVRPMAVIDERVAVADGSGSADYAISKIRQERLLMDFATESGNSCMILRPGLVYDQSRLAAACAGILRDGIGVLASHRGEVPTIEVHGLAAAIANAVERNPERCEVIHLVDDRLPSQPIYLASLQRRGSLPRIRIVIPWRLMQGLCYLAGTLLSALGWRDRLPEVLLPPGFSRRLKPFRFSNAKAQRLLDWIPGREFA
jgi:2-alkyl-3-oxoalkanoate reductase